jgi:predicted nucleotidyltransferase
MLRHSSSSGGAIYLDRNERLAELTRMAARAAATLPEIRRIILFGSTVTGIPTPRSDADLLVEVDRSDQRPRDRAMQVVRAMQPLSCPVDLFVYTRDELQQLEQEESPLVADALSRGRLLFERHKG